MTHPLPTLPVNFSAPANSAAPTGISPAAGEESFSQHLVAHTESNTPVKAGNKPAPEEPETSLPEQDSTAGSVPQGLPQGLENKNDLHPGRITLVENMEGGGRPQHVTALLEEISTAKNNNHAVEPDAPPTGKQENSPVGQSVSIQAKMLQQVMTSDSETGKPAGKNPPNETNPTREGLATVAASQGKETASPQASSRSVKDLLAGVRDNRSTTVMPASHQGSNMAQTKVDNDSPVVIEQWQATFSKGKGPTQQPLQAAAAGTPLPKETVLTTENGQLITVSSSDDLDEAIPVSTHGRRNPVLDGAPRRRDGNSQYIHSNLHNKAAKQGSVNIDRQPAADLEQQADPEHFVSARETGLDQRINSEKGAVPFSIEIQPPPGSPQPSSSPSPVGGLLRMPSGILVPEQVVMDQVINHFSGTRKLETGSIKLQLHPQELGELRLEIEVKQDNVKAHITTQNPQAMEALDRHLPRLRETLAEQGLHLNDVEITVSAGDHQDGHRFQENEARHQLGKSYRSTSAADVASFTVEEETAEHAAIGDARQGLNLRV